MLMTVFLSLSTLADTTANDVTTLTIENGKVLSDFAVYYPESGTTIPLYILMDDPMLRSGISGQNPINSTLASPLKIACFKGKNICLLSGNLLIFEAKATDSGFTEFGSSPYKFVKNSKKDAKVLNMELAPIDGTDYFLSFVTSSMGIFRYKLGTYTKFSMVETKDDFVFDRFARGLLHIRDSSHGLASVFNVAKVFNFDVTKMEKITSYDLPSGKMVELTLDRSTHFVASGGDQNLTVFKYSDGTSAANLETYYFITDIGSVHQSNYILTAEDNLFKVYTFDGTNTITETFSRNLVEPLYAVKSNYKMSQFYAGGFEVGKLFELNTPTSSECHPACSGGCTKAFSPSACSSCGAGTSDQNGTCL